MTRATKVENSIGINDIVRRQTPDSKFSYFTGNLEELVKLVRQNFGYGKKGYRKGVLEVPVHPGRFFTNVVELEEGDELSGTFKSRRVGEIPRKSITVIREGASSQPAQSVNVILYRKDVLAEDDDNSTEEDWEIVSINAFPTDCGEELIDPETLMHNHFESDGGTDTKMTDEEFVKLLRNAFLYHKNKATLDPGSLEHRYGHRKIYPGAS